MKEYREMTSQELTALREELQREYQEIQARGLSLNDAGCAALLAMLAANPDTNVIARSSLETQKKIARETAALLEKEPFPGEAVLKDLDRAFTAENISPGGTADLLALVYLLWFLKQEAY